MTIRIELLSKFIRLIPTVAKWHWDEWGHLDPNGSLAGWTDGLASRANEDKIPLTIIALDGEIPVGSASIVSFDMDTRRDLSPWLAGVFVLPEYRSQGVGGQLVRDAMVKANALGIEKLYLYTRSAIGIYEKLGWEELGGEEYQGRLVKIMFILLRNIEN
jgi:GNAT superfamily N-acetyltransferase